MPRLNNSRSCFFLSLLLCSACLFAEEQPQIAKQEEQNVNEPKTSPAKDNPPKEKEIAPERRIKVGVKGLFAQEFLTFSTAHLGQAPVMGLGGIFEYPLEYVSLGGQFDTGFAMSREFTFFDINAFAKAPFAITITTPIPNFYVALPIGLSLGRFSSEKVELKSIPKGFNVGGKLGKDFFFNERFGILVEAGYVYRYLGAESKSGVGFSLHFHELMANVGLTVGF